MVSNYLGWWILMGIAIQSGWWFGTFFIFPMGRIVPTDSYFSEGKVNHQPDGFWSVNCDLFISPKKAFATGAPSGQATSTEQRVLNQPSLGSFFGRRIGSKHSWVTGECVWYASEDSLCWVCVGLVMLGGFFHQSQRRGTNYDTPVQSVWLHSCG